MLESTLRFMMDRSVGMTDFKNNMHDWFERADEGPIFIIHYRHVVGVILSPDEYDRLRKAGECASSH
jgi:hypothetical protein